jgi:hypothetical protein
MVLGLSAAPALAAKPIAESASQAATVAQAVCPGQTFSQPFSGLEDSNYYTLVPGSEFEGGGEGWQLLHGAHVSNSQRPDGSEGSVLDLPSGSMAISPPVCVTLQYPTARVWTRAGADSDNVIVAVVYTGTRSATVPVAVGAVGGTGEEWQLSEPFALDPELGGKNEEAREVRFVFAPASRGGETQIFGVYVDPRMV